jgi:hypothetical protein
VFLTQTESVLGIPSIQKTPHILEASNEKKIYLLDDNPANPTRKLTQLNSILIINGAQATMTQLQSFLENSIDPPANFSCLQDFPEEVSDYALLAQRNLNKSNGHPVMRKSK